MNKEQMLNNFIKNNVKNFEGAKRGLAALKMLGEAIDNHVGAFEDISKIFQERNLGNLWIDCPDCFSPVLINYKDCNICGRELLTNEEALEEVKPVKKKKKVVKEEIEEEIEEELEEEIEEAKPVKKAKKKAKKVAKKVKKVVKEEIEEEAASDYPSEDKINAMGRGDLTELIKKEKLDVDASEFKGRGKLDDLREAVNDAIDFMIDEENSAENEEDIEEATLVKSVKEVEEEAEEELEESTEEEVDGFDFEFDDEEEE